MKTQSSRRNLAGINDGGGTLDDPSNSYASKSMGRENLLAKKNQQYQSHLTNGTRSVNNLGRGAAPADEFD